MAHETPHLYEFGPFKLDPKTPFLLCDNQPVSLTLKALETLVVLVERSGRVVSRDELIEVVWPDVVVEENNLSVNISFLRKALGDSPDGKNYIETVPRRGYRFVAAVRVVPVESLEVTYSKQTRSTILVEETRERAEQTSTLVLPTALNMSADSSHARALDPSGAPTRPQRRTAIRWSVLLAIAVLAVAIGVGLIWRGRQNDSAAASKRIVAVNEADAASGRLIAVLPIKNLTGDEENAYLADGLTESLMTELSIVNGLRVIAHNTSFAFKDKEATLREVTERLGVTNLIEGSVRRDGDRIRVETRLINAASGEVIWLGSYERPLEDIITMQDGIACSVASELQATLCGQKDRVPPRYAKNLKAYRAYMKGRFHWYQRGRDPLIKAIAYFEEALRHDSNYALAFVGLAETYMVLEANGIVPPGTTLPKAIANAEKALELDSNLAGAYATLGHASVSQHKFAEADKLFQKAVTVNPNYATAWHWRANQLKILCRYDEALAAIKKAQELDPLSVPINSTLGGIYYSMREPERVLAQAQHIFSFSPENANGYELLVEGYELLGRYDEALAAAEKYPSSSLKIFILAQAGRRKEALQLLAEVEKSEVAITNPATIARAYALLNDKDQAFVWLEKVYALRQASMVHMKSDPAMDSLRSDPRFTDLLKRMNLAG